MKTYFILGDIPWQLGARFCNDKDPPHSKKLQKSFLELFASYNPKPANIAGTYFYPAYGMEVEPGDARFDQLVKRLDAMVKKFKPPCAAGWRQFPTPEEAARARFIEPKYYGSYVDEDAGNDSLALCTKCRFPNLKTFPKPFLVSKAALKKCDIFHAEASVVIVRSNVLELFRQVIGGQFTFGEAAVAKTKTKVMGNNRLFWVRPKAFIGERIKVIAGKHTCPECKRKTLDWIGGLDSKINHVGPGVLDDRLRCSSYEKQNCDIALLNDISAGRWPVVVMSGALLTFLEANKVKGLLPLKKDDKIECVFSQTGEPPLEPSVRMLGASTVSSAKASAKQTSPDAARTLTASLKYLPWGCDRDGYVYFHLSTPALVVLDPMTGEEDDGGPYKVKNFKKAGVYRLPIAAIREGDHRGIAVDSGALVFVDSAFLSSWIDSYEWKKALTKKGVLNVSYHQNVAEEIGSRFGICTPPPKQFTSVFQGDGFYKVDAPKISFFKT